MVKPLSKRVFNGKLAFLSMVDPDKTLKLKTIMDKHRQKTVEDMIDIFLKGRGSKWLNLLAK